MKFVLQPSLEHMALVKISVCLWNQNDVRALIIRHGSDYFFPSINWNTVEEIFIGKVSQLSLPQSLKEKVLGFIKPIGLQLLEWTQYHVRRYVDLRFLGVINFPAHPPVELFWTPQGTVNWKRTAEVLVRDANLNAFTRYILPCEYCLEDDIIRIWNDLPENVKDYDWDEFPVINFWSDNMKRGGAIHLSYKFLFWWSALTGSGSIVAAKYFLQKLTPQEIEEYLEEVAEECAEGKTDVLCFLLSEMEEEKQKKVLKNCHDTVLSSFLQWPWQSCFIRVASCMWDFLSKDDYDKILGDIIDKVGNGYKDYNFQNLFRDFLQKSPRALKYSLFEEVHKSWLRRLFANKNKEITRLVLNDATVKTKKDLIYNKGIYYRFTCSINENDWDFLKFFIRECWPSKNEMLEFKTAFEKCVMHSNLKEHFATKKPEWDQLFCFSDDSICEYGKRSVEEGESSSSKRFQSLQ